GSIAHLPGGDPACTGQCQGSAQVVKLVVEHLRLLPFPLQLCQGFETAGFINKAAVLLVSTALSITQQITVLGNQVVGLPQEFGNLLAFCPLYRLANAATKSIVGITCGAAIRQFSPDQLLLAVVVIAGHQLLTLAAPLQRQSAKFVVLEVAIATEQQPVPLGAGPIELATRTLTQEVASRIMQEALGQLAPHLQQAVQRIVAVVLLPLHAVIDAQQVARSVIAIAPLAGDLLAPLQTQRREAPLLVIFVLLGQFPLLP